MDLITIVVLIIALLIVVVIVGLAFIFRDLIQLEMSLGRH